MITQSKIKELFTYRNGELYRKVSKGNVKIDDKAGTLNKNTGYYSTTINNKIYYNHRLIFLYHNSYLPKELDHIDGNRSNNNIENLREVTRSHNCWNSKSHKNSSSKYKGIHWDKQRNKWRTQIYINGKSKYLGRFENEIDAAKMYNEAAIKYYVKFAKLNEVE